jgi:hypothetical protein
LGGQAFWYAATGSEEARTNAWNAWGGIEMLNKVTGITGLVSLSYSTLSFGFCVYVDLLLSFVSYVSLLVALSLLMVPTVEKTGTTARMFLLFQS